MYRPQRSIQKTDYIPALRFHRLTALYDPLLRWTTREGTFKQHLLKQAAPEAGNKVLDLGCGTGTLAVMVKEIQPQTTVVGIDADQAVLERARRKAKVVGTSIQFDQALSTELPYSDSSFDLVLSSLFFHHLVKDGKRRTFKEIARVLKPGGTLHVADWGRPTDPLMSLLSLQIRLFDGVESTRDNISGALPALFEEGGLSGAVETSHLRTVFGTLALYSATSL